MIYCSIRWVLWCATSSCFHAELSGLPQVLRPLVLLFLPQRNAQVQVRG
jgi:hypothetical protein